MTDRFISEPLSTLARLPHHNSVRTWSRGLNANSVLVSQRQSKPVNFGRMATRTSRQLKIDRVQRYSVIPHPYYTIQSLTATSIFHHHSIITTAGSQDQHISHSSTWWLL